MEISDYINNCMSTASTRDFLEMKGEKIESFKAILIKSENYRFKGDISRQELEEMAEQARNLGCKYITNIHPVGYNGFQDAGPFEKAAQELILVGTGLIPKNNQ